MQAGDPATETPFTTVHSIGVLIWEVSGVTAGTCNTAGVDNNQVFWGNLSTVAAILSYTTTGENRLALFGVGQTNTGSGANDCTISGSAWANVFHNGVGPASCVQGGSYNMRYSQIVTGKNGAVVNSGDGLLVLH